MSSKPVPKSLLVDLSEEESASNGSNIPRVPLKLRQNCLESIYGELSRISANNNNNNNSSSKGQHKDEKALIQEARVRMGDILFGIASNFPFIIATIQLFLFGTVLV